MINITRIYRNLKRVEKDPEKRKQLARIIISFFKAKKGRASKEDIKRLVFAKKRLFMKTKKNK